MISFITEYWIGIIFTLLITLVTNLYRKISKYIKKIDALQQQACLNLKIHIVEKFEKIRINNSITIEEKEELGRLYALCKKVRMF